MVLTAILIFIRLVRLELTQDNYLENQLYIAQLLQLQGTFVSKELEHKEGYKNAKENLQVAFKI